MNLQTFDFNENPIRVLLRDDQPWFVAVDVCRVLELANSRDAIASLDEDEKGVANADTLRSTVGNADIKIPNRGMQIVSESGLYALIFKSRKPEAKKFRKWVTADVLPAIRRSGGYSQPVDGIEQLSLLRFVREMCADWSLERQMDFGQTARRYAKSMGLCFQTGEEPGYGRVFIFPREMLCELRLQVARVNALPNGEAAEFERLLAAIHEEHGDCTLDAETVRGMAKTMRLFRRVFHEHSSPAAEAAAFGSLVQRYERRSFLSGLVVHVHRRNGRRQYEVQRSRVMAALAA